MLKVTCILLRTLSRPRFVIFLKPHISSNFGYKTTLKERKLSIINTLINVFPDIKEIEVLPPILSSLVFAKGIEKAKTSEGFSYVFKYTHAYKLNP